MTLVPGISVDKPQIVHRMLSRKFLLAVASVLSCTLLVWFGKINDGVYSAVMLATIAAYLSANVLQKREERQTQDKLLQVKQVSL